MACFSPDMPEQTPLGEQYRDTLQAQIDLWPQLLEAKQAASPQESALSRSNINSMVFGSGDANAPGLLDMYLQAEPQLSAANRSATTAQRSADIADVATLGPQAYEAFRSANPQQAALMDQLNTAASDQLALGSEVDPNSMRTIERQVLGEASSRGWGYNPGDMAAVGMSTGARGQALQQQRQNFGMNVANLNQATSADPFMAILGRPANAVNQSMSGVGQGQSLAAGIGSGFNPESAYAQDWFNTGYNAQAAGEIAQANNQAAFWGGAASY